MQNKYKFSHINIIAKDWKLLSKFYQEVFGCIPVLPERNYFGKELAKGTGIENAALQGIHLQLPGFINNAPTLEIFSYNFNETNLKSVSNRLGLRHLAFEVENVFDAREKVLSTGGKAIGEIVSLKISTGRKVTWCYVTDPEENIIELQKWN